MKGKISLQAKKMVRSRLFNMDLEAIEDQGLRDRVDLKVKQVEKRLLSPSLKVERVLSDPRAWVIRIGKKHGIAFDCTDPEDKPTGIDDSKAMITLLRFLDQQDFYMPSLENDQNG